MKKLYLLFIFILISVSVLKSQDKGSGIGIIIGEPTGISFKQWMSSTSAIDVGIAYSLVQSNAMHVHLDYVLHNYNLISVSSGKLPFYYGIGGRIKFKSEDKADEMRVGVRIPLGLSYHFPNDPVDIFIEVVPVVDFSPVTKMTFGGGLGARYFFNSQ